MFGFAGKKINISGTRVGPGCRNRTLAVKRRKNTRKSGSISYFKIKQEWFIFLQIPSSLVQIWVHAMCHRTVLAFRSILPNRKSVSSVPLGYGMQTDQTAFSYGVCQYWPESAIYTTTLIKSYNLSIESNQTIKRVRDLDKKLSEVLPSSRQYSCFYILL